MTRKPDKTDNLMITQFIQCREYSIFLSQHPCIILIRHMVYLNQIQIISTEPFQALIHLTHCAIVCPAAGLCSQKSLFSSFGTHQKTEILFRLAIFPIDISCVEKYYS